MIVGALEIVYSALRLNHPSRELVPWVAIFMPIAAVFHAITVLVIPESWGLATLLGAPHPFKLLSPLTAISFGSAALVAWLGFEKRRAALDKKYQRLRKFNSIGAVIALSASAWIAGVTLLLLCQRQPVICLIAFLAFCAAAHLLAAKRE
jgi:hypothetical protein